MTRTASSLARLALAAAALATALLPGAAAAQGAAAGRAGAVLLQIRPRVGDTLRLRLDQTVEMAGTRRVGEHDSTASTVTSMQVHSRAIAQRADAGGAVVLAITDSVTVRAPGADQRQADATARAMGGKRMLFRLAPDGGTSMLDDVDGEHPELGAVFAQMPAMLPRHAVRVGEAWTRAMSMGPGGGRLTATFRLDSLTRGGELAHLSMVGAIAAPEGAAVTPGADVSGDATAALVVDRRRGWVVSSSSSFSTRQTVAAPGRAPMQVRMKVSQRMRVH